MKLKINIGDLVDQIALCAITIDPKSVDQPNSKIYLRAQKAGEAGVLYSYSTNQLARTFIRKEAEVLDPGEVLIDSGRLLGGLANRDRTLPCTVEAGPEKTVVRIGKSQFGIPNSMGADKLATEVDNLPFKVSAFSKITAGLLTEFIKRTSFCIPVGMNGQQAFDLDSMSLQRLGGVYRAYASDGNIINYNYGPTDEGAEDTEQILIPQDSIFQLQKLVAKKDGAEDIELVKGVVGSDGRTREVFFRLKGMLFGCKLRSGKYPNLKRLLEKPRTGYEIDVPRDEFKGALLRAGNFNEEGQRLVTFVLEDSNAMKIRAGQSKDMNLRDEAPIELVKGDFTMMKTSLNLDYIANAVAILEGEKTHLGLSAKSAQDPVIIRGEDMEGEALKVGSIYVVNPVKMGADA